MSFVGGYDGLLAQSPNAGAKAKRPFWLSRVRGGSAELFRDSQAAVLHAAIAAMPSDANAWERVELATRAFLRAYVLDTDARALLAQAMSVLGWDTVREIDEQQSLPVIRAPSQPL